VRSIDVYLATTGGKQPSGRFRPGIVAAPFAEHDLAHYVIDAAAGGLARSGVQPYLEYDPEIREKGPAAAANEHHPRYAVMVAFASGRTAGVRIEVAPDCDDVTRSAAVEACLLVTERCGLSNLGVSDGDRAWLRDTRSPAWWLEVACLDQPADRECLERADSLQRTGEAVAEAWCGALGRRYRGPDDGSSPVEGASRVAKPERTGWFAENHPTLGLGAGLRGEPSDPTAHAQTMLGVLVDGRFGYVTQMALQAVQRRFGLTEDGVCGPATWAVLHSLERQGAVGYTTKEVQRELNIFDDGVFGPVTSAHVEAFQRVVDTASDGRMTADHYRRMLSPSS
jgi:peptidoglycan hydrolase-like protein with peptidoglycan-binding domain